MGAIFSLNPALVRSFLTFTFDQFQIVFFARARREGGLSVTGRAGLVINKFSLSLRGS